MASFENEIKHFDSIRNIARTIYMNGAYSTADLANLPTFGIEKRAMDNFKRRLQNYINSNEKQDYLSTHKIPLRKKDKDAMYFHTDSMKITSNFLSSLFFQHTLNKDYLILYLYLSLMIAVNATDDLSDITILDKYNFSDFYEMPDVEEIYNTPIPNFDIISELIDDINTAFYESEKVLAKDSYFNDRKGFTREQITDSVALLYKLNKALITQTDTTTEKNSLPALKKIYDFLSQLVEDGILLYAEAVKTGTEKAHHIIKYFLPTDIFGLLTQSFRESANLQNFKDLLSFYVNYTAITFPGHSLLQKLDLMQMKKVGEDDNMPPIHPLETRYQNILDDPITWTLINAIDRMQPVTYRYQTVATTIASEKKEKSLISDTNTLLLPIKIIEDIRYGRHYVFGWKYQVSQISDDLLINSSKGTWVCHRIDRINHIDPYTNTNEKSNLYRFIPKDVTEQNRRKYLQEIFENYSHYAWNIEGSLDKTPQEVLIHFCFDNHPFANEYLNYLQRTKGNGTLLCIDEEKQKYDYRIDVISTTEMIPWINRFGDTAQVDPTVNPTLFAELKKYNEEVLRIYEPV